MTEKRHHFLKEWRKFRGLSQAEAAEAIGRSANYLSELERDVKRYNADTLEALSKVYGCEPADLLGRDPQTEAQATKVASILSRIPAARQKQALEILETFTDKKEA